MGCPSFWRMDSDICKCTSLHAARFTCHHKGQKEKLVTFMISPKWAKSTCSMLREPLHTHTHIWGKQTHGYWTRYNQLQSPSALGRWEPVTCCFTHLPPSSQPKRECDLCLSPLKSHICRQEATP